MKCVKRWVIPASLWIAAIALWAGCGPSHNTVEEADRQGIDTARQVLLAQDVELDRIEAAVDDKTPPLQKLTILAAVNGMREKNRDAKAIVDQLQTNFHPPQQPQAYTHAEVQSLLKRMHDAHEATFWAGVGSALLAGAGIVIAAARSPIAKMIPGIGTILTSLDGTMAAVETWMQKMKESGKPEVAEGLAGVLEAAHQDPRIGAYIDKKLGKIKAEVPSVTPAPEIQLATALAADEAVAQLVPLSSN